TKIGMVGCGFYAQNHLNAWTDLRPRGAEIVAVCDLNQEKAQAAGETFGAAWYTDVDAMLDSHRIDLLDIATQMSSHRDLAAKAVARGVASIIQKPLAPRLEDCVAIVNDARNRGVWLAVHENFRFGTGMRRVKETCAAGAIGSPNWARISFRTGYDVYSGQPYLALEKRLSVLDSGIHVLDLARFFLGEVDRVYCENQKRNSKVAGEDTATIMLRHRSGAVSVVETTYESRKLPDPFPETMLEIEGSEGAIILSAGEKMTVTSKGRSTTEDVGAPLLSWTSHPWHVSQESVLNANAHFLETFRHSKEADTSGTDNLKTFALVEAAYESAASHSSVRPKFS
ncbi:MAG: Gfo/Idh/MocA family oxidoreductase, partial [Albidovulum sp.]|nr:Gfo/Idh/MocA family oxidoreductase [Albidovulum sp.]MDE0531709.1 Gfo/Idh/MocA family oxidoreductase [Albidovulum sp.]